MALTAGIVVSQRYLTQLQRREPKWLTIRLLQSIQTSGW
jgi:hypothetical protein